MAIVIADDSFKKPGAIPFKWETRPGVSKYQQHNHHEPPPPLSSSSFGSTSFDSLAPSKELQTKWLQSMSLAPHSKKRASLSLARLGLFSGQHGCFSIPWAKWWKWGKERKVVKPKLKLKLVLDPESMKDNTFLLEKLARWSISASARSSTSSFSTRVQAPVQDQVSFRNDDEAGPSFSAHIQRAVPDRSVLSNDHEAGPSFSARTQGAIPDRAGFSNDDETARVQIFNSLLGFLRRPKMLGMGSNGREKKEINISVYLVNN